MITRFLIYQASIDKNLNESILKDLFTIIGKFLSMSHYQYLKYFYLIMNMNRFKEKLTLSGNYLEELEGGFFKSRTQKELADIDES